MVIMEYVKSSSSSRQSLRVVSTHHCQPLVVDSDNLPAQVRQQKLACAIYRSWAESWDAVPPPSKVGFVKFHYKHDSICGYSLGGRSKPSVRLSVRLFRVCHVP